MISPESLILGFLMCEMRAMTLASQGCESSIRKVLSSVLVSIRTSYTALKTETLALILLLCLEMPKKQEECAYTVLRIQSF